MWPVATDDPVACVSACLSLTWLRCAKTVEGIEVLFGVEIFGDSRHIILHGVLMPLWQGEGNGEK